MGNNTNYIESYKRYVEALTQNFANESNNVRIKRIASAQKRIHVPQAQK